MRDVQDVPVKHPRTSYHLNPRLFDHQQAWENADALVAIHQQKLDLFDEIEHGDWDARLPLAAKRLEDIEYEMQRLWKFRQDARYHEWYLIPGCSCPKKENKALRNELAGFRIIATSCQFHKEIRDHNINLRIGAVPTKESSK